MQNEKQQAQDDLVSAVLAPFFTGIQDAMMAFTQALSEMGKLMKDGLEAAD